MKQIPFTLDAFGPDGLLKEGYEVRYRSGQKPDFVKKYVDDNIVAVDANGNAQDFGPVGNYLVQGDHEMDLVLYRRTRTAPEVAKLTWNRDLPEFDYSWDALRDDYKKFYINLVQAGMDEMR